MSQEEVEKVVADYAKLYPPLVTAPQAAEIAGVPLATVYQWSSQGDLGVCKSRRGKHVRFSRDCLVRFVAGSD
jgi:excisionase family DNA binding protein